VVADSLMLNLVVSLEFGTEVFIDSS
jgi:hypothetical protein